MVGEGIVVWAVVLMKLPTTSAYWFTSDEINQNIFKSTPVTVAWLLIGQSSIWPLSSVDFGGIVWFTEHWKRNWFVAICKSVVLERISTSGTALNVLNEIRCDLSVGLALSNLLALTKAASGVYSVTCWALWGVRVKLYHCLLVDRWWWSRWTRGR